MYFCLEVQRGRCNKTKNQKVKLLLYIDILNKILISQVIALAFERSAAVTRPLARLLCIAYQLGLAMRLRQIAPTLYICAYMREYVQLCIYAEYADMHIDAHRQKRAHGQP